MYVCRHKRCSSSASIVSHLNLFQNSSILYVLVSVYVSVSVSTAHKQRCRGQVSTYLEHFEPDVRADIQRDLETQLQDLTVE